MPWSILVLLAALLAAPPAHGTAGDGAPVPRPADPEELERVMAESRVETAPNPPGLSLYVADAAAAVSRWLVDLLDRYLPGFGRLAGWILKVVPALLYGLLALTVGILVARLLGRWWKRSRPEETSPVRTLPAAGAGGAGGRSRHDAAWWEAELRRRLAGEDLPAALEALWWWLARVLEAGPPASAGSAVPADVERSWTSRELISRAGRPDLRPLVGRLDRLIYGPDAATGDELRRMFGDLREAVG